MAARPPFRQRLADLFPPARLGFLALLAATGFSGWLVLSYQSPWPVVPAPPRHEADYYFEGFHALRMGLNGEPVQRLTGARMSHFPDDDSTELEQPHLLSYADQGPPWELRAERARITERGDLIYLPGPVQLNRSAGPANADLEAETEDLTLRVQERVGETERAVSIVSGGDMMRADGMRIELEAGRLQLLSRVRATYEPNRR